MPKLYYDPERAEWQTPGHQQKGAVRFDIPSSPNDLAVWFEENNVIPDQFFTTSRPVQTEQDLSMAFDEAWETMPFARRAHFAALFCEEAREKIK